jgi:hypothetical protein
MVAIRDILQGEIVFGEDKPFVGPTTRKDSRLSSNNLDTVNQVLQEYAAMSEQDLMDTWLLPYRKLAAIEAMFDGAIDKIEKEGGFHVSEQGGLEKVKMILNMITLNDMGHTEVYLIASHVEHSCCPNCVIKRFSDGSLECRAIQPIVAGSRLTSIHRLRGRNSASTSMRRFLVADLYEFTCHCPRCDAPGDDTRQFNCFDPSCTGRHLVCQPLSDKPFVFPAVKYTGVEYVEPHLLPCTVCQGSPPASYQADMFKLEKAMEAEAEKWEELNSRGGRMSLHALVHFDFHAIQHHILAWRIAIIHYHWYHIFWVAEINMGHYPEAMHVEIYLKRARLLDAIDQEVFPAPNETSMKIVGSIAEALYHFAQYKLALPYCRRAVRMRLLLRGRESRDPVIDGWLAHMLRETKAAPAQSLEVCGFCEESPDRAAMKRSRCGACKAVMYCSVGCQKAHWALHKAQCKKA